MRQQEVYESSLEKVSRILSDRYDIRVSHHGDKCYTDGRNIVLPAIPEDAPEGLLEAMEGYLDHETGHVIFDDFEVLKQVLDPFTRMWTNAFCDPRIRHQMEDKWRGCGKNFRAAADFTFEKRVLPKWEESSDLMNLIRTCIYYMEEEVEKLKTIPNYKEWLRKIKPLQPALKMAREAGDTLHSLALACWVVRTMGREPELGEIPEPEPGFLEELFKKLGAMLPPMGSGKELAEEFAGASPEEAEEVAKELESATAEAISEECGGFTHHDVRGMTDYYVPYSTSHDQVEVVPPGDKKVFLKDLDEVRKNSGVLTRHLRTTLVARAQSCWEYEKSSGQLNPRAFPRLLTQGYAKVFKQRSVGEVLHGRACLLVDQSGSMRWGRKYKEARRASTMFGEFLDKLNIPFEILGFSTVSFDDEEERYANASEEDQQRYTRWGDMRIDIYKQFHESFQKVGHRLSHMNAYCHNYDGEAVRLAGQRLLLARRDPKERLILFVFSDGRPEQAVPDYQPHHQRYLHRVIEDLTLRGVETIGIGICDSSVENYYPSNIVITDPADLMSAQFLKLKEVLMAGRGGRRRR